MGLGVIDHLVQSVERRIRFHYQDFRAVVELAQVVKRFRVVGSAMHVRLIGDGAYWCHADGVAVRPGPGQSADADAATTTGTVIDNHVDTKMIGKGIGESPTGQITTATGGIRHDFRYWSGGKILRQRQWGHQQRRQSGGQSKRQ